MSSTTSNKLNRKPFTPILSSAAAASVLPSSSEKAAFKHDSDGIYTSTSASMQVVRQPLSPDRPSAAAGLISIQRELEFAKAELAREQTQRKLDRQKAEQESARLRRQMEFLVEELDGHREESEKIRLQSEKDVQSLKHRLEDTIQSLKSLEEDYDTLKNKYKQEQVTLGPWQEQRWIDRCKGYEEEVAKLRDAFIISEKRATEAEQKLLQYEQSATLIHQDEDEEREEDNDNNYITGPAQTTSEGKAAVASMISVRQQMNRDPVTADDYMDHYLSPSSRKRRKVFGDVPSSICSPAPPAVMRELTKVRLSLADSERTNRMLTRKYEEAKNKLQELRKVNEQYERSQERVAILESQYSSVLKKLMTLEEVEKEWKRFRKDLCFTALSEQKTILMDTKNDIASSAPPEISTVIRKIQSIQNEVKEKAEECEKYRLQLEASNQRIHTLQGKIDAQVHSLSQMKQQHDNEKKRINLLQMEVDRAQASERIAKMEAKSMQQLLNTYELLEASEVKDGTMKIPGVGSGERNTAGPIISGLRTSLSSAQEEINVLKETHSDVCKQLETLQGRLDEKVTEHERVLDKFNKLKASLMEEREKARVAEDRALHAESLAGKGHFDPDKTRALHLKENPFMKAVRAKYESQISALEAVIERHKKESEYSPKPVGSTSASSTPAAASSMGLEGLEAKKLNQRLKDSFQEHIGVFREAVYLLTGYKIDMIMDSDSPRFRVRSMYAEREEDHLLFVWPKAEKGVKESKPTRLDLLDTDLAISLSKGPTFEYLSKYDSLPAFLASLTLSLFENTTFAG